MKIFLLSAILLASICNFGDCANGSTSENHASTESIRSKLQQSQSLKSCIKNKDARPSLRKSVSFDDRPKFNAPPTSNEKTIFSMNFAKFKKSISFNDKTTRVDAPPNKDEDAIFWMNKLEFFQNVRQKSRLHGPETLQTKFLDSWVSIMQNNYLMFEKIFKYGLRFGSSSIILDQSEVSEERPIPFPDTETIEKLQKEKDAATQKLLELFNVLEPSYLLNEELYNMMKSNYNAKTVINQEQFDELIKESELVERVTERFDVVFKDFPIETYTKHLAHIRKTMSNYEHGKIEPEMADKDLKEDVAELEKCYPNLQKALDSATGIGLKETQEAIKRFHALVKKVLKVDKVSSSSNSFKKLFSGLKLSKNKSKK